MLLFQESKNDWYMVALVLLLGLGANLPGFIAERFYINQQFLVAGLALIIAVSLIRYLKFALLLVVVILAVGANLPEQIAAEIGVDRTLLLLGLALMVITSFANKFLKLETGLEKKPGATSLHGAAALFKAIEHGRVNAVEVLLGSGVNPNVRTVSGVTPLILASSKGNSEIVRVLLEKGANPKIRDRFGKTSMQIAEILGFTEIAEMLGSLTIQTESVVAA